MAEDQRAQRTVSVDQPTLAAGAWWREVADEQRPDPLRMLLPILLAMGLAVVGLFAGAVIVVFAAVGAVVAALPAPLLERQQKEGWAVGAPPGALDLVSECALPDLPPGAARTLATDLAPRDPRFTAWNRAQLLAAAAVDPPPESGMHPLAEILRPLCTTDMRVAHARGASLAELLAQAPPSWAVIVDLPGPEAVAVAAALSGHYEPVWTFEGWPHPKGAAPSHLALGAALYYRAELRDGAPRRNPGAPPVIVLDSTRHDGSFPEFDNRYRASLPSVTALRGAGIDHVLYVRGRTSDGTSADIDDALRRLHWNSQIPVQLVALQDFQPVQVPELPEDPASIPWYWGGSPDVHWYFWTAYGLGDPGHAAARAPILGIPWVPERPAPPPSPHPTHSTRRRP
jgi:hypothetical protein